MNKTLLLILCDFLLLNLLALTNWQKADVARRHDTPAPRDSRGNLSGDPRAGALRDALRAERDASASLENEIAGAERDAQTAAGQAAGARGEITRLSREAGRKIRVLDIAAGSAERGRQLARDVARSLETLADDERRQVVAVKSNADLLGKGVEKLERSGAALKQAVREAAPLSPSRIARLFSKNKVFLETNGSRDGMFGRVDRRLSTAAIIADDGRFRVALSHGTRTPFDIAATPRAWETVGVALSRGEKKLPAKALLFMAPDPRIVGVLVMPEVLKQLGVEPVRVSRDPLRFEQAVFVNTSGKALRVELTHIPGVPWYVAVKPKYVTGEVVTADAGDAGGEEGGDNPPTDAEETVTVTREARELMPSPGDFVFDKMGALIGVMVNERFCAVISELGAVEKLDAGDNPPTLEKLKKLSAFPKSLPYGLK